MTIISSSRCSFVPHQLLCSSIVISGLMPESSELLSPEVLGAAGWRRPPNGPRFMYQSNPRVAERINKKPRRDESTAATRTCLLLLPLDLMKVSRSVRNPDALRCDYHIWIGRRKMYLRLRLLTRRRCAERCRLVDSSRTWSGLSKAGWARRQISGVPSPRAWTKLEFQ